MTRFSSCLFLILASLACPAALGGETIGRLFFTPAERNALEAGKSVGKPAAAVQESRTVRLNGVVLRTDSERTVWVNGKAYHDVSPDGIELNTRSDAPGNAEVRVRGQRLAVPVKVGQQVELNKGKISARAPLETKAGDRRRDTENLVKKTKHSDARADRPWV